MKGPDHMCMSRPTAAVAGSTLAPVAAVAVAAAALAVAHVGYTLVEQPIRHHRALVPSGRRSMVVGLGLSAACIAGLVVVRPLSDDVSLSGQAAAAMAAPLDLAELADLLERSAAIEAVPPNLRPTLQAAALDGPDEYVAGCNLGYRSSELLECELGDVGGLTSVVLIGDSHAAHWIPALDIAAREAGIRLISHTKSACPVSTNTVFVHRLGRSYTECDEWRERVFQRVNQIRPDGVIVVQASGLDNDHLEADYQRGWVTSIERLQTSGADVIVLSDTPYPLVHPPECLAASPSHASGCAMTRSDGVSNQMSAPEQAAAATGASFVRTESLLCGPEHCPVIVGDLLVYRDTSHLTTLYSAWLAGPLAQLLGSPWS